MITIQMSCAAGFVAWLAVEAICKMAKEAR